MKEMDRQEKATMIKDNEVLALVNSTIKALKKAHYNEIDVSDVIDIDDLEAQEYQKYEQIGAEVMQYWVVSRWLGEKLAKEGSIIVPYENHYYLWGRTGYGYALEDDFVGLV
ncbi:hypothetical protein HMPREF0872_03860 [Veillonella montpellierensis DNF00314]|uniref:Uncharacterized protein n=1 Tax=Veillonella montpellierensis DNF00314 TaxID=1401067 RepID=A0A096AKB2_9FIRM|nr:hypothetical protein [Veillonella montpellierensis]KGF47543.1 hypothetical protein HMPREF0872_03860 [Veillonella montpellierensis DNF00314]